MQLPTPAVAAAAARQKQLWRTERLVNMFGRCQAIVHEADECDCIVAEHPPVGFELFPTWKSPNGDPVFNEERSNQCPECFQVRAQNGACGAGCEGNEQEPWWADAWERAKSASAADPGAWKALYESLESQRNEHLPAYHDRYRKGQEQEEEEEAT